MSPKIFRVVCQADLRFIFLKTFGAIALEIDESLEKTFVAPVTSV
jgi:hypothetical protein